MAKPWMIITGATGLLGGQLVRMLRKEYRIIALGRRTPAESGVPEGPGIEWFRVDIGQIQPLREVFSRIRDLGGAEILLHMAAFYDFTGEENPEYNRTNIEGTRNILALAEPLKLRRFIFTSSTAACPFPAPGERIDESTEVTADFPYARAKRACEAMMREWADRIPTCIVRPAAVVSDWCEYPPLTEFLQAWCSRAWNSRILGGRGVSALPYLHVEDLMSFYLRVVERCDELGAAEVLIASPDGSTTHLELFLAATRAAFGRPRCPVHVPRAIARPGVAVREWLGRRTGRMPFERTWMLDYVDMRLEVDASRTRARLDWAPSPRLHVLSRLGTMVENMRVHPEEWRLRRERRRPSGLVGLPGAPPDRAVALYRPSGGDGEQTLEFGEDL
jgi:nucleoside-diphosphate-sugar epimerase